MSTIDGDEFSEVTIGGDEVREITMGGDVVYSAGPDAPPVTSGLIHHWDASDFSGGESVTEWECHVSGAKLEPTGSAPVAIGNEIDNEHTVVYCDDDYMEIESGYGLSWPFTVVMVGAKYGSTRHWMVNHNGSGPGGSTHIGYFIEDQFGALMSDGSTGASLTTAAGSNPYPSQINEPYFWCLVFDTSNSRIRFMNVESSSSSLSHRTHEGISLGATTGYPGMDQDYAVILVYDRLLSSSERNTLYTHYRDYYNLSEQ